MEQWTNQDLFETKTGYYFDYNNTELSSKVLKRELACLTVSHTENTLKYFICMRIPVEVLLETARYTSVLNSPISAEHLLARDARLVFAARFMSAVIVSVQLRSVYYR